MPKIKSSILKFTNPNTSREKKKYIPHPPPPPAPVDDNDNDNDNDSESEKIYKKEKFDAVKYSKLLAELYPSSYSKSKAESIASMSMATAAQASTAAAKAPIATEGGCNNHNNYNFIINIKDPTEDGDDDDDYETDSMDDSVYDDDEQTENSDEDDDDDDDDSEDGDSDSEDGNSEDDDGDSEDDTEDEDYVPKSKRAKKKIEKDEYNTDDERSINALKQSAEEMLLTDANDKIALSILENMNEKKQIISETRKKRLNKQMRSNVRKFGRLLNTKQTSNDLKYFKTRLTKEEQERSLAELSELNKIMTVDKPYRLTLLDSRIPLAYKAIALKRINLLRYMDPGSGEYCKIKNWVDTFMTIPFNVYRSLPISIESGIDKCHDFMESAKTILNSAVYGLNDAKMQIMQMVGQWVSNPSAMGTAIAIKGPPGTGKTTILKDGISKIMGRDFAFIALGGATDSSFLEGHSYTYEGSTWGKIVEILIRCKSMNPVIFFDELDKISETAKGQEIAGILTHLTDTSQNQQFHDKYFSEVNFDLSKCLFIFSYNDESKVNPILLDRMYKIHTNGYNKKDKVQIAQKYLIPKIQTEVAFNTDEIIVSDEIIEHIVEHHTAGEDGVRNLKRCLEIIYTKLNLYRLMRSGSKLFDNDDMSIKVTFPFTVTTSVVDMMIKTTKDTSFPTNMYM